ncbi:DUF4924 family protein [Litoribacter ruber]|uniref:DUF4924 family protein n=1 Tax=Litoribacter ruber TaxID=702568 RepID=A0AAP2CJH7_9BACT|nr:MULTISPECIES: DUF4924 family protein [Litoribacter]MBS9524874.1 DUF4924 family protein [Litoribacter alkaliphilus]MBT0811965.1 DUF4924 family protein [Litoribacter ruber]
MKDIAEKKKSTNIGEYIIYMYQMEDLIRSYQFNMEDIQKYVVSHYPVQEDKKEEIYEWFSDLGDKMQDEGVAESGHLSDVQAYVKALAELHWELLKTDKEYFQIYDQAKPHILDFISSSNGQDIGHEVQICLNGIYGLLLARLTGKTVSEEIEKATSAFGAVLGYLNFVYMEK